MKTSKSPRELLKKSHAHKSKKDYRRDNGDGTWQKEIDANCPNLNEIDWENLPDRTGGTK